MIANINNEKPLTIRELATKYDDFARVYYRKPSGRQTREAENVATAMNAACKFAGHAASMIVDDFNASHLLEVQKYLIGEDLARTTINARINRIRRVFKWGVSRNLVRPETLISLQCVAPLKIGRSSARESHPVEPVSEEIVFKTCEHLHEPVRTMVLVQLYTAMRPGEVVIMRTCDIEKQEKCWFYTPFEHKTEHNGTKRIIAIGPKAQELIEPFLSSRANPFLFPTLECERWIFSYGDDRRYSVSSYAQAVRRASIKAGVPTWCPLQLRHTAATQLRKLIGIEAARVVLGHSRVSTTEIYAEMDNSCATDAMTMLG